MTERESRPPSGLFTGSMDEPMRLAYAEALGREIRQDPIPALGRATWWEPPGISGTRGGRCGGAG